MTAPVLLGRGDELHRIQVLIGHARNGRGGALLLTGEPGVGKTTLLDSATADVHDMLIVRVDGYEAEASIAFAAVQRFIRPLRDHVAALPERQAHALWVACGQADGPPPDRFLVGLAILGLLAVAGEHRPVLGVVDDAHLLDSESLEALAFVARRLEAESGALLLATRSEPEMTARTAGITELPILGLAAEPAATLLRQSLTEHIDAAVVMQIVAATGGNPLALVDLARELTVRQLTETSLGDEPVPIGRHLESFYLRQVRRLREPVQVWLLVAAADSTGNLNLIEAAGRELDLPGNASGDAEQAGLVELGHDARFRHPLVRSAAYNAATGNQRRRVHRALSLVAEKLELTELAAWHAAKATLGADEEVAQRLETVADLAATRGGFSSRARVLTQAAALTPPGPRKHARLVHAAEAALASGTAQLAKSLMDDVDDSVLDPVAHGRLIALGADYSAFTGAPTLTKATEELLCAAEKFHDQDAELEQASLIRAWEWALPAERLVSGVDWQEFGRRLAAGATVHDGPAATILRGLSALVLLPYEDAIPDIRAAVAAYDTMDDASILRYGHSSVALTTALWDLETRNRTLARWAAAARNAGSLQQLDNALWVLSLVEATSGTPRQAVRYTEQVRELRRAIGWDAEHVINLAALSWNPATRAQIEPLADATLEMGYGGVQSVAHAALAVIEIAEGRYEAAYHRLKPFIDDPFFHVTPTTWPDFIEAATRSRHVADATAVCDALERRARTNGSPWALGLAARSQALLADGEHAEAQHRTAIEVLSATSSVVDHARAHLNYGEWLRRTKRRKDARTHLHHTVDLLEDTGADPFADRARRELAALGDTSPRQRRDDGGIDLTPQERTVAELAAAGKTNAEIGAAMFLSANTVDYHLRKVYQRLGISSRRQLTDRI